MSFSEGHSFGWRVGLPENDGPEFECTVVVVAVVVVLEVDIPLLLLL
jgi:hypothetical protein